MNTGQGVPIIGFVWFVLRLFVVACYFSLENREGGWGWLDPAGINENRGVEV